MFDIVKDNYLQFSTSILSGVGYSPPHVENALLMAYGASPELFLLRRDF